MRILLATLLVGFPVFAHDFWMEAGVPVHSGDKVSLRFWVGQLLAGDEVPYRQSRAVRFESRLGKKVTPLSGEEENVPAAWLLATPGVQGVAYESTFSTVLLDAEKFRAYLKDEHLDEIIQAREARGEFSLPGRERYARSCRSALVVPGAKAAQAQAGSLSAPEGLTLELVPESDLSALTAFGGDLRLRLLYKGKPMVGKVVTLRSQSRPLEPVTQNTDNEGRVHFDIQRPDFYLAKSVHMVRCEGCADADWESRWASFTFRMASPLGANLQAEPLAPAPPSRLQRQSPTGGEPRR